MNTDLLARSTFVLHRSTAEQLTEISERVGKSRSELVREILAEPVQVLYTLVSRVPENPTEADLRQLQLAGLDLVDDVASQARHALGGAL